MALTESSFGRFTSIRVLVPGTGTRFRCGGLSVALQTARLLSTLRHTEVVTYRERTDRQRFLDDLLRNESGPGTALWIVSWGFDVRVPVANTVGKEGDGLKNTLVTFERARCHMAAWGYSIARRALEESVKYSQERTQHGKQIAGHQLIALKIAKMATEIDAARLLTLRAADMIDNGIRCDKECSMAKWYGTEIAVTACRDAVQIHGGNGVTKEFIVERLAREAIVGPIPDGTTEIQQLLIARLLTGIQAFK